MTGKVLGWRLCHGDHTPCSPERATWREAAQDAVDCGVARWDGPAHDKKLALRWLTAPAEYQTGGLHYIDQRTEGAIDDD